MDNYPQLSKIEYLSNFKEAVELSENSFTVSNLT